MAQLFENVGLDILDDETEEGLMKYVLSEGHAIGTYYGTPYFYKKLGDTDIYLTTRWTDQTKKKLEVDEIHVHTSGNVVWEVSVSGPKLGYDGSKLVKRVLTEKVNGLDAVIPIEIITSGVLPCYADHTKLKLQVVAFPLTIHYYKDDDEYDKKQYELFGNEERFRVEKGNLVAMGFLKNYVFGDRLVGEHEESDLYVMFKAVVKQVYVIRTSIEDSSIPYLKCVAETEFGDMEFIHSLESISEEERDNIQPGAIIDGVCIISGDAAIDEYELGPVRDEKHDLMLIKHVIEKNEPERLERIVSKNAQFASFVDGSFAEGSVDTISKALSSYIDNKDVSAKLATLNESDGSKRTVLGLFNSNNLIGILEIDYYDNGRKAGIIIAQGDGFNLTLMDERNERKELLFPEELLLPTKEYCIEIAQDYRDYDFRKIALDMSDRHITNNISSTFEDINESDDREVALHNIVGYYFAKGAEMAYLGEIADHKTFVSSVHIGAAIEGISDPVSPLIEEEKRDHLQVILERATWFYDIYNETMSSLGASESEKENIIKYYTEMIYNLGRIYGLYCMPE